MAELSLKEKNKVSHRGKALKKLRKILWTLPKEEFV
jgi:inosine/xanthosine triphosphate pyrophosphatase family protein